MKHINNIFDLKQSSKLLFSKIVPRHIILDLKGKTEESVVNELFDILELQGKILNRAMALKDLLDREQTMSTGIPNGIAIPHAKTTAVQELTIAIGIQKSGIDFDSPPLTTKPA